MLKNYPTKPCRFCGERSHWSYKCIKNPKKRKYIKKSGKYAKQWDSDKATWYRDNPPIQYPYPHYICYLPGHNEWLRPPERLAGLDNPLTVRVTLDHKHSRGRHPDERSKQSNLAPCCGKGNQDKGSKDIEMVELNRGSS